MTMIVRRVRALLRADSGLELQFVRHRQSGTVHVVMPDDPNEVATEFRFSEIPADAALAFACGDTPTICGYLARTNIGDRGDVKVGHFDDNDLCTRCWRVLGPEFQQRAFEHPQTMQFDAESGTWQVCPDPEHTEPVDDSLDVCPVHDVPLVPITAAGYEVVTGG